MVFLVGLAHILFSKSRPGPCLRRASKATAILREPSVRGVRFRGSLLIRGAVLSLSFVEPHTRDDRSNQMNQLPATRREMGLGICSFFRFSGFETDAAGSRCGWFHELTDGFEERMDMVIVRFDPPL